MRLEGLPQRVHWGGQPHWNSGSTVSFGPDRRNSRSTRGLPRMWHANVRCRPRGMSRDPLSTIDLLLSFLVAGGLLAACSGSSSHGGGAPPPDGGTPDVGSPSFDAGTYDDGGPSGGPMQDASADGPHAEGGSTQADASSFPVPGPAAAAGFNTLVFEDDFTTSNTIAPTQSAAAGYKWYWSFATVAPGWTVATSATAASIANGNSGGGANASAHGGILTVTGPDLAQEGSDGPNGQGLITVPGASLNNGNAVLPAEGDGCWSHAYFEAYLQFKIDGNVSTDPSNGWPAFWSWSVQGLHGFGFGSSSLTAANYTEIDFMESYGSIFNDTPGTWTATMHRWPGGSASDGDNNMTDDNWHTYGCLWTSTGNGTGQVQFFFDGTQVDKVPTGTNQTQFSLESMAQFLILGSGQNWNLNVDWVHVWQ